MRSKSAGQGIELPLFRPRFEKLIALHSVIKRLTQTIGIAQKEI
jgi:hypothetical protein